MVRTGILGLSSLLAFFALARAGSTQAKHNTHERSNYRREAQMDGAREQQKWGAVWIHGLGDRGRSWAPIEHQFAEVLPYPVSWVFPDAPQKMIRGSMMPAWFSVGDVPLNPKSKDFVEDYKDSVKRIHKDIDSLVEKGIPTERIFIGGFSQGGALAIASVFRSERKLAGAICLSGWVVEPTGFGDNLKLANKETRLLWAHGARDGVVGVSMQDYGTQVLKEHDIPVEVKRYQIAHTANDQVLSDVAEFMGSVMREAK